jgi:hypothetical protein
LLLISTLSAPSAAGAGSKMLRYGTHKTAGHPSALPDAECRKRIVAGKVTPLDSTGDLACLPAREAFGLEGMVTAMAIIVPSGSGAGHVDMRGARAPPLNFT